MENTNYKRRTMMAYSAVIVQGVALLITFVFFVGQKSVKALFGSAEVADLFTVPIVALITYLSSLIFYLIFASILAAKKESKVNKGIPILFFGLICVLKLQVFSTIESHFSYLGGTKAIVSLAVLDKAIGLFAEPFTIVAYGLFCLAAGMCICEASIEENSETSEIEQENL